MAPPASRHALARCACSVLLAAGTLACGGSELASRWMPEDAAMVRCTTAGRDRMPPVLLDLPVPSVPTGLLARQLDPMALNDMGYEREQPVCAALLRPSAEAIEQARPAITTLLDTAHDVGIRTRSTLGRCACDIARAADVAEMVATCKAEPHRSACSPSPAQIEQVRAMVQPLREALAITSVPRVHWRLAGRSDRPGWLVERSTELLSRHGGGTTVFVPGQAIPSRHNHGLVRRMLDVPGTVAVMRQDGGRALLVVRELEGALVLDLLMFPRVDPALVSLLPFIDDARADEVAGWLERPTATWVAPLSPSQGNLVHVEREGLAAVDAVALALAPLAGLREAPTRWPQPEADPLVEAVTLQAPFGHRGQRLLAKLRLSDAGQQWAQALTDEALAPPMDGLGLETRSSAAEASPSSALALEIETVLHGSPTERLVLDGLPRIVGFMQQLEMQHPGAVSGTHEAWTLTLPPGAIAPGGTVPPPRELGAWAEQVGRTTYRVRSELDPARQFLTLTLAPE